MDSKKILGIVLLAYIINGQLKLVLPNEDKKLDLEHPSDFAGAYMVGIGSSSIVVGVIPSLIF